MTTFTSYGAIPRHRQGELIRQLGQERTDPAPFDMNLFAVLVAKNIKEQV